MKHSKLLHKLPAHLGEFEKRKNNRENSLTHIDIHTYKGFKNPKQPDFFEKR